MFLGQNSSLQWDSYWNREVILINRKSTTYSCLRSNGLTHLYASSSCLTLTFNSNPLQNLFFRCCDEPRHLDCPFTKTVIRVQSASHSSMLWEVNTIDLPPSRDWMTTFHKLRLVAGSKPIVTDIHYCSLNPMFELKNETNLLLVRPRKSRSNFQWWLNLC